MKEPMTTASKDYEFRKLALDAIDYIYLCNEKNIAPLRHDANIFTCRFNAVDKARRAR